MRCWRALLQRNAIRLSQAWLGLALGLLAASAANAVNNEPAICKSADPAQWPPVPRPYVLLLFPTDSLMTTVVGALPGSPNSCNALTTRLAHADCAVGNWFKAYSGNLHMGLTTYARVQSSNCTTYSSVPGDVTAGCGTGSGATRAGFLLRVPIYTDAVVSSPPATRNFPTLQLWTDFSCGSNIEVFANGTRPINGALRDAKRYLGTSWTDPITSAATPSPLSTNVSIAASEAARRVYVVLLIDGDENCDTQADAVAAAQDLFNNGVTLGGVNHKVSTYVINFTGATQANADAIAAAGGTGSAFVVNNEATLTTALAAIATTIQAGETCNNADDDGNGCTDEGFPTFGNVGQTCCAWGSVAQRNTCLANFAASITAPNPQGNRSLLPCASANEATTPSTWLCVNPGEICDNIDNNLDGQVDEGMLKCGSPAHCPVAEVCNGVDDNCNGLIDEGNVCPGGGVASAEVCDSCDNDFDGNADNGVNVSISCGFTGAGEPPYCAGTRSCKPPQSVPVGTCAVNGGFTGCNFGISPLPPETCDGLDNDCNGIVDDGVPPTPCIPAGTPTGLVYGGTSQCRMGSRYCNQACIGFIGPTPEVTDAIDNNCNGVVDEGVDTIFKDGFEGP